MKKANSFRDDLLEDLADPRAAQDYLNAALEEGDAEAMLIALRDVVEARGGVTRFSEKTGITRKGLYKVLSKGGNPELDTLQRIAKAIGLDIAFAAKENLGRKVTYSIPSQIVSSPALTVTVTNWGSFLGHSSVYAGVYNPHIRFAGDVGIADISIASVVRGKTIFPSENEEELAYAA